MNFCVSQRLFVVLFMVSTFTPACSGSSRPADVAPFDHDDANTQDVDSPPDIIDANALMVDSSPDLTDADVLKFDSVPYEVSFIDLTEGPIDVVPEVESDCGSPFVYLKDKLFRLGNEPFVPISVNYIFNVRYTPVNEDTGTGGYFIAPPGAFCADSLCCTDPISCRTEAVRQLAQIKSMGINSLRVIELAVVPKDGRLVLDCGRQYDTWVDYCPAEAKIVMSPALPTDSGKTTRDIGLDLMAEAMSLVRDAGLKVILLAGHGALDAPGIRDLYTDYLTALATRFADDPTIFAYDLTNEPIYEFADKNIDKVEANAIGRAWYDAVRAGTKKQMVTMGLAEIGTVRHWDPGSVPLDFVSYHIYGIGHWTYLDRNYISTFYNWMGREPYPTMVGETGASVGDDGVTDAMQQAFAQYSLDNVWACGSMGLQWWIYRDLHWGPPGEHYGLVRWDGTERPAAIPFKEFVPIMPRPACKPALYEGSAPAEGFHTTGRLIREDGTPVANGFISGHKCYAGGWDWTISKADGTFDLLSHFPVNDVEMTAAGLSVETKYSMCGVVPIGDVTLKALPLSMEISTPSSCP